MATIRAPILPNTSADVKQLKSLFIAGTNDGKLNAYY